MLVTSKAMFDGIVAGDVLTVTAAGTFDSPDVGTGRIVAISGMALGGASAGNYVLSGMCQKTTAADILEEPAFSPVLIAVIAAVIVGCIAAAAFVVVRRRRA